MRGFRTISQRFACHPLTQGRMESDMVVENGKIPSQGTDEFDRLMDIRQDILSLEEKLDYFLNGEEEPPTEEEALEMISDDESGDQGTAETLADRVTRLEAVVIAQDKRLASLVSAFRNHRHHPPQKDGE